MGGRLFGDLPLTAPMRELRPDRAEPRLFPGSVSRPVDPLPVGTAPALSAAAVAERVSVSSPTIAAVDRFTASEVRVPAGRRRSLGLVGLIAAVAIATLGGTGLWLLASAAKVTVAASESPSSASAPPSAETAIPHAAAVSAVPAASVMQHPAESETASLPQINGAQARPPAPPPTAPQTAPAGHTVPAFAEMKTAPKSPSPSLAASTRHAAASSPTRDEPRDHTRTAARHAPLRSAHDRRPPVRREARVARSSMPPPADQTRSFDQLLTQLTGRNPPAGQALTPPPADQPDPFAPRASSR
jgi:hypothetical protein